MHEQLLISDRMASVGTLAAGVAHEINNPLSAVLANLDFALQDLRRVVEESPEATDLAAALEPLLTTTPSIHPLADFIDTLKQQSSR